MPFSGLLVGHSLLKDLKVHDTANASHDSDDSTTSDESENSPEPGARSARRSYFRSSSSSLPCSSRASQHSGGSSSGSPSAAHPTSAASSFRHSSFKSLLSLLQSRPKRGRKQRASFAGASPQPTHPLSPPQMSTPYAQQQAKALPTPASPKGVPVPLHAFAQASASASSQENHPSSAGAASPRALATTSATHPCVSASSQGSSSSQALAAMLSPRLSLGPLTPAQLPPAGGSPAAPPATSSSRQLLKSASSNLSRRPRKSDQGSPQALLAAFSVKASSKSLTGQLLAPGVANALQALRASSQQPAATPRRAPSKSSTCPLLEDVHEECGSHGSHVTKDTPAPMSKSSGDANAGVAALQGTAGSSVLGRLSRKSTNALQMLGRISFGGNGSTGSSSKGTGSTPSTPVQALAGQPATHHSSPARRPSKLLAAVMSSTSVTGATPSARKLSMGSLALGGSLTSSAPPSVVFVDDQDDDGQVPISPQDMVLPPPTPAVAEMLAAAYQQKGGAPRRRGSGGLSPSACSPAMYAYSLDTILRAEEEQQGRAVGRDGGGSWGACTPRGPSGPLTQPLSLLEEEEHPESDLLFETEDDIIIAQGPHGGDAAAVAAGVSDLRAVLEPQRAAAKDAAGSAASSRGLGPATASLAVQPLPLARQDSQLGRRIQSLIPEQWGGSMQSGK